MADESETIYGFGKGDADAIMKGNRKIGSAIGGNDVDPMAASMSLIGFASGSITARSGTTLGSGNASLYTVKGDNTMTLLFGGAIAVANGGLDPIDSGKPLVAMRIGKKYVVWETC